MSAPTSPNSPRSVPSSADPFAFEGTNEILLFWRDGLTPDPALTVSQWADRHRILSPRASAEPGRYRTDRTPYMRAIMDALSPSHPARRVVLMKAAQVGFTEAGNNWIGYVIHHAPGPMLAVQPTVELAKRFSRQRIDPLIEESPALRQRVKPARSRDAGNTVLSKEFPAGLLVITGANSAVGLRSMPARYLFLDEVDAYPPSADEEGDPVALAEARTRTFSWRSKILLGSTPTIHGFSRIEREYEASDRRRFFVPCPHCGHRQWLRFERLRWDKGEPRTAHYLCEACEGRIEEHHKTAMLAAGEWRATAEPQDPATIGFHLSALCSPVGWFSWSDIARMWESAQATDEANRDTRSMRSFTVPWIPHDDVITPQDIQGVRGFGVADAADPLATVMERKLTRMRVKHAQTREYMEVNALRGIVKDGAGTTLYNYFTEFGLAQQSVDFVLGTAGTNVQAKVREVLRKVETELKGETMAGVLALVAPEFFDKLIGHAKVEDAYKYFSSTGAQPLREDTRRRFPFAGIVFEEYNATVTLSTGGTETLVPASEGIAYPLGTLDTFVTYGAPANLIETVNTMGLPIYARQIARPDGSAIEVKTEASILPINKRPRLAVRIYSSN